MENSINYSGEYAVFNYVRYKRDQKSGYFTSYINGKTAYLHREVWRFYYGEIPKGYHVHHLYSKNRNEISDLSCISEKEHKSLHLSERWTSLKKQPHVCLNCKKMFFSLLGARFCSEKCNKKFIHLNEKTVLVCKHCGKEFEHTKHRTKDFCSRECMLKHFTKTCQQCGAEFIPTQPNQIFCSQKCGNNFRHQQSTISQRTKKCPHCGKMFVGKRTDQIYCCNICAQVERTKKYRAKKRLRK